MNKLSHMKYANLNDSEMLKIIGGAVWKTIGRTFTYGGIDELGRTIVYVSTQQQKFRNDGNTPCKPPRMRED